MPFVRSSWPPSARHGLAPRVQVAALRQGDEALDLGLDRLRLRLGGLDALVVDHLTAEVHQQRLAMRGAAAELSSVALVAHGLKPTFA